MTTFIRLIASPSDDIPEAFYFATKTNIVRGTLVASDPIVPFGYNVPIPISVANGEYSFNGTVWVSTPGTITPGSKLYLRHTASSAFATSVTTTVTINGVVGTFTSTSEVVDTLPDSFTIVTDNQEISSLVSSDFFTPTGYNSSTTLTVNNSGQLSIDGVAWTTSLTITPGLPFKVRGTTSASYASGKTFTISVGATAVGQWTVWTRNGFANATGVNPGATYTTTTLLPYLPNGSSILTSINNGGQLYTSRTNTWTTSDYINVNSTTIQIRGTASTEYLGERVFTVSFAGNPSFDWKVTTRAADIVPATISSSSRTGELSTYYTSATVTPTGYELPISFTVTNNGIPIINGVEQPTSSATISPGQTLAIKGISASSYSTQILYTADLNGVPFNFYLTTRARDIDPGVMQLTNVTVSPNTVVYSDPELAVGYDPGYAVPFRLYSMNVGSAVAAAIRVSNTTTFTTGFTTSASVSAGQYIQTSVTASPYWSNLDRYRLEMYQASASSGLWFWNINSYWDVSTTTADTTPDPFTFTNLWNITAGATVTSEQVALTGFTAPGELSVTGSTSLLVSLNGGPYTTITNPTPVAVGTTIQLKMTASTTAGTIRTATVTLGTYSTTWKVATYSTPSGSSVFTTGGTSSFTVPANVTSICIVAIGGGGGAYRGSGGGGGGGGGQNCSINNVSVTPEETLTVNVGGSGSGYNGTAYSGGNSYVMRGGTFLVYAQGGGGGGFYGGGLGGSSTTYPADYRGNGGRGGSDSLGYYAGGGGAGGFISDGGSGATTGGYIAFGPGSDAPAGGQAGTTGGGGGGGCGYTKSGTGAIIQSSVVASGTGSGGGGGSGGTSGSYGGYGTGGGDGGGAGAQDNSIYYSNGAEGAVRILWGTGRSFPFNSA